MKTEFEILGELNLKDKVVLEVGCGNGRVSRFLADKCPTLFAIDSNKELIAKDRTEIEGPIFNVGNGEKLGFRDNEFDVVIFSKSLHHLNPQVAINEAVRVLKNNGEIVIIELVPETEYQQVLKPIHNEKAAIIKTAETIKKSGLEIASVQRIISPKEFRSLEDLLNTLEKRFNNIDKETVMYIKNLLLEKINEKPLKLDAKLDIYKLRVIK